MLDKPSGITSARAVACVKRLLPKKTKVGHTGTLDPLASGLLVLLIGRATRLSRYVTHLDKSYAATARLGATSDTLDTEGEIYTLEAPIPDENTLRTTLPSFTGELRQVPPMASAVRVGGERLYDLHRRGEEVERESRSVAIHSLELTSFDPEAKSASFEVSCTSGTYVRTLLSDLASSLGSGAYLTALRRTRVGHLRLQDALPPEELTADTIDKRIIQPWEVVAHLPVVEVDGALRRGICNGRKMGAFGGGIDGSFCVEVEGELLAVYRDVGREARPEVVLCGG